MTEDKKQIKPYVDNDEILLEDLQDPEFTAHYLNAAIEDFYEDGEIKTFNKILGKILKSGNLTHIAKVSNISRQQLYRMINNESEASFVKTLKILNALGYQFKIEPIEESA